MRDQLVGEVLQLVRLGVLERDERGDVVMGCLPRLEQPLLHDRVGGLSRQLPLNELLDGDAVEVDVSRRELERDDYRVARLLEVRAHRLPIRDVHWPGVRTVTETKWCPGTPA